MISHPSSLASNCMHTQMWVHLQKGALNLVIAFIIHQWIKKWKMSWATEFTAYVTPFIQVDRLLLWVCPFQSNDGLHYKQVSIYKKPAGSASIINHQPHSLCTMNSGKRLIVWFLGKKHMFWKREWILTPIVCEILEGMPVEKQTWVLHKFRRECRTSYISNFKRLSNTNLSLLNNYILWLWCLCFFLHRWLNLRNGNRQTR